MEVDWHPEEVILSVLVMAALAISAGLVDAGEDGLHITLGAGALISVGLLVTALLTRNKQRFKKVGNAS